MLARWLKYPAVNDRDLAKNPGFGVGPSHGAHSIAPTNSQLFTLVCTWMLVIAPRAIQGKDKESGAILD